MEVEVGDDGAVFSRIGEVDDGLEVDCGFVGAEDAEIAYFWL